MPWKKVLLEGDVVTPNPATTAPPDVGTPQVGTSTDYARADHSHGIEDGAVTNSKIADGAVTVNKINIDGNLDFNENEAVEMALENADTDPTTSKAGRIYFNTSDGHPYVYVP